ncbi:MAG: F0F1 ATP synthase subunit A [Bacteroidales bacterium]|nr:F0F1 ATP synthase subunit A [Bacteroidales bacterium]
MFVFSVQATENDSVVSHDQPSAEAAGEHHADAEEFNAGKMIIEHIIDAHEWHILTWKGHHVSIPLPVILLDNGSLVTFCSSRLHHGESYNGYILAEEGPNKGRIVKVNADGHIDEQATVPIDFSITKTVLSLFIGAALLLIIFLSAARRYKANPNRAPKGIQSLVEPLILFVRDDIAIPAIGKKKYMKYMPYLLTIFFFIFLNNLMGLIPFFPGGVNLTGNLAITMVLAIFTFIITTFSGNRSYWVHIINTPGVPWWLKIPVPLMPVVEIIGLITKPFVLMVRLFANITAGHIILLGFMSLIFIFGSMSPWIGVAVSPVSILFGVFMTLLELLVAFIQAYVFALLSAIYFGMAVEEHHHEHASGHEPQH